MLPLIDITAKPIGPGRRISMGGRPLNFTVEKPIPAAQAASGLANVVPLNKRGRLLAKHGPIISTRSSKTVMPTAPIATQGGASGWCGPKDVIIAFAHVDRGGPAAEGDECRSNASETGLTVSDYVAMAYVFISAAFFPALAWLLSS
jgi:hypothetical protein